MQICYNISRGTKSLQYILWRNGRMKIYYNLTKIENGWILQHPDGKKDIGLPHRSWTTESYFSTFSEALRFMDKHFQGLSFDK